MWSDEGISVLATYIQYAPGPNAKSVTGLPQLPCHIFSLVTSSMADEPLGPIKHEGLHMTAISVPTIARTLQLANKIEDRYKRIYRQCFSVVCNHKDT